MTEQETGKALHPFFLALAAVDCKATFTLRMPNSDFLNYKILNAICYNYTMIYNYYYM